MWCGAGRKIGSWTMAVGGVGSVLLAVRKHQGIDRRAGKEQWISNAVNDAVKFCGYDAKRGDIFLDGFCFPPVSIAYVPSKRNGAPNQDSRLIANYPAGETGTAKFKCERAPKKGGTVRVALAAFNGYDRFRLVLNGNVVHDGKCPKGATPPEKGDPRHFEFEVPATFLKKGENVLELANTSPKWMEVVYVVIQGFGR